MGFFATLRALLLPSASDRIDGAAAAEHVEQGATLIDVRTPGEFARGHIPGAINIPLGKLPHGLPDDVTAAVLYCASGRRTAIAVAKIGDRVPCYDLGPMSAWTKSR